MPTSNIIVTLSRVTQTHDRPTSWPAPKQKTLILDSLCCIIKKITNEKSQANRLNNQKHPESDNPPQKAAITK